MTLYRLKAIENTAYKTTIATDCELPLNTPIMFVKSLAKNGSYRLGFKKLNKSNDQH